VTGAPETKIAVLAGVREHCEGMAVELWLGRSGRVVVRAYNECGNNCTDVDLMDLIAWAKGISNLQDVSDGHSIPSLPTVKRDQ
jgi:hypothetical protein